MALRLIFRMATVEDLPAAFDALTVNTKSAAGCGWQRAAKSLNRACCLRSMCFKQHVRRIQNGERCATQTGAKFDNATAADQAIASPH